MLTKEIMGVLALSILWVNTLLIVAAALKCVAALRERRRLLEDGGLFRATIARGEGEGGVLAVHRVEQIGRAGGDEGTIVFVASSAAGEVLGGALAGEGDRGEIALAAGTAAEVWLAADELAKAASCPSDAAFDQAFDQARKARGLARTVTAGVAEGQQVFVHGQIRQRDGRATLVPVGEGVVLIATLDPTALLARKIALALAFVAASLLAAAGCTALALRPPYFGVVSTVGGALSLGFFLLIQPAGTALRDTIVLPSRALIGGRWARRAGGASAKLVEDPKPSR